MPVAPILFFSSWEGPVSLNKSEVRRTFSRMATAALVIAVTVLCTAALVIEFVVMR